MMHKLIIFFLFWTVWSYTRNWCILYWQRQWDLWLWGMLQSK